MKIFAQSASLPLSSPPDARSSREWLRWNFELIPKPGVDYFQAFPGVLGWVPGDPAPKIAQGGTNAAHHQGVRVGNYPASIYLICPHFNGYENSLDHPKCPIVDRDGSSKGHLFCFSDVAIMPGVYSSFRTPEARRVKVLHEDVT